VEQFSSFTEQFHELADFANVELPDELFRKIEGIVALLVNLKDCGSYQHFMSAVFLYIRDFYDTSITKQVMEYLREVFDNGTFEQQSNSKDPSWLLLLREVQSNWALVKGNKAFRQFSKLMSILVTLGLCDASDLTFSIGGFKLFDEEIMKKHLSAFDLADALLGTVTYFVEGAYLCFKTRSIKPLLLNDFSAMELDTEYTNILMWWDLVKNGNLERIVGMSDAEFGTRLRNLINALSNLMLSLSGLDKKIISDKVTKMKLISNELITLKISSGTRKSPFAIELFGDSNQGKTTFGDQLLDALLVSNDLPVGKEYRAALNPGDKFFSNWTSDKLVAILDDLANEKSDFVEKPPTRAIIDICNNQMYYAPKAELEAKGKCFVEPEIVLVTTNKKDLDAYAYSNCPYSVQRRMDLVFTVKCKKQFQRTVDRKSCGVDSAKVRQFYTIDGEYCPPAIDDIWSIDVEQAIKPDDIRDVARYKPIKWRNKTMKGVSSIEAIQCAVEYMNIHRANQQALMDQMKKRTQTMTKCVHKDCPHLQGFCPDHKMKKQFGLQTAIAIEHARQIIVNRYKKDEKSLADRVEDVITKTLYKQTKKFTQKWDWICVLPSECFENETCMQIIEWFYKEELQNRRRHFTRMSFFLGLFFCFLNLQFGIGLAVIIYFFSHAINKSRTRYALISELKRRNDSIPVVVKNTRDGYAKALCYSCVGVAALYAIARVYKAWKSIQDKQGSLEPKTPEEVQERDKEKNVWAAVYKRSLPTTEFCKTTTPDRLENSVLGNVLYASVDNGKEVMMANVVMMTSNVLLIPNHYFEENDTLNVTCRKENADSVGGKFTTRLCLAASVLVPDTDFRICYSGTGGSYKDITKYLPTGPIVNHPFRMSWRQKSGELIQAKGLAIAKDTSNGTCVFAGSEYKNLTINTFGGLCGAVLISDTKTPCISGFHLGGQTGTPFGCSGTLTLQQVNDAIASLREIEGVLITGKGENFIPQSLGIKMTTNDPLHKKSPLNYLPEGSQFAYYGSCIGATTSRSDVRKTPISDAIKEVTGVENTWGAPKMKPEWFAWQTCLANASEPGKQFPHELLAIAVEDYKRPLMELAAKEMWQAKPLTDQENINGVPGCKFIDSINMSSSIGFPLTGAKRKYINELEPTKEAPCNREFTPEIMEEIKRVEDCYRRGERAYTVAKACKKDEILPASKEKCRVFYGNPISLTFLIRKYFLPVTRLLQMNPLTSECAVGINCHGPEWDEFYKHVMHHGEERVFGGDYGKYDQKLPSQLLHASLRILIDLAEAMGYEQEDLDIMSAMAGDIVYSLVAVNGDLIGLTTGGHISGNPLTVILNGISGSLNLRIFFYSQYPKTIKFRDAAHIGTYGDDNIGTVSPKYPKFNIKDCSHFLAEYGQVYTMPDKESELTEYLSVDDFEFLKRTSVHHPALGVSVGALLDSSIFKSLHCYMRPKGCPLTPHEACAQNIDGALREWFNHGKEVYEKRRVQMKEVATKVGIAHMCTLLDESYEQRVADWYYKYGDSEQEEEVEQRNFTVQSGVEEEDLCDVVIADMPLKCIAKNVPLFHGSIGEIDLLFETLVEGVRYFVLIEVKTGTSQRCKGFRQVRKYCQALQILQPESEICGIVVDLKGWHPVLISDSEMWYVIASLKNTDFLTSVVEALIRN
jgi:hypothetical protein